MNLGDNKPIRTLSQAKTDPLVVIARIEATFALLPCLTTQIKVFYAFQRRNLVHFCYHLYHPHVKSQLPAGQVAPLFLPSGGERGRRKTKKADVFCHSYLAPATVRDRPGVKKSESVKVASVLAATTDGSFLARDRVGNGLPSPNFKCNELISTPSPPLEFLPVNYL